MARCGECEACKKVEATKKIVLAETIGAANAGIAVRQSTVDMWNAVLAANPCVKETQHTETD